MFVLHVGPHKTATTWLQQNFHHNIKALEQAGWFYPQTGERVRVAHHDISDNPDEVLDPSSRKVRELNAIARKSDEKGLDVLMSSEGFRNWRPEHIRQLQAIMAPHEMRIVYCVRDPASLLYSFWAQQIKSGSKNAFPDYSRRQLKRGTTSRVINPLLEIDALAELQDATLTLLLYDEIRRQNRDIFDVFVENVLKIPPLPHAQDVSANERQPLEMTEFMRLVQLRLRALDDRTPEASIGLAFRFMMPTRTQEKIVRTVAAVGDARKTIAIKRNLSLFRQTERVLLEKYRPLMVPQPAGKRLFLDGALECAYYDAAVLENDPGVKRLLDDISNKFRPGGLRLWVMGWSRFWLALWRRIAKFLRR
jgi:hypothetical protein